MKTKDMPVRAVCVDGHLTVTVTGEIDHHSAAPLREEIDRHLYLHHPHDFCLSLGGVHFMDSSGLGLILGRLAVCRSLGCPMRLTDISDRMRAIFRMAGLWRMEGLTIDGLNKKEGTE